MVEKALACDEPWVLRQTDAQSIERAELVQPLWGGYGELWRIHLRGAPHKSVILKKVSPPPKTSSLSDTRKRRSYQVELAWYSRFAPLCGEECRVAKLLGSRVDRASTTMILEDLQAGGFVPVAAPTEQHAVAGLWWLAHFHSQFLGKSYPELWEQGTYWHLETRAEELQKMPAGLLKRLAHGLDQTLRRSHYQTLVHGDAKTTNFCWQPGGAAAAVDFQYVGRGCGIRDVALFLDRAIGPARLAREKDEWLNLYFRFLQDALNKDGHEAVASSVVEEWGALFCVAWSDYARFRQGWARPKKLDPFTLTQLEAAQRWLT